MSLDRLKFAPTLAFFFLCIKSWMIRNESWFWIHLLVCVGSLIYNLLYWERSITIENFFDPVNQIKHGREDYQRPSIAVE